MLKPEQLKQHAASRLPAIKKFFNELRTGKPSNLDEKFHHLHTQAFQKIDCLTCANCCKTTSPIFTLRDIKIISKYLKLSEQNFISRYLRVDEDGDYVLQSSPCAFLLPDNTCSIYDYRPNACREYPHTNQRKMHTIFKETINNTQICPAVFDIVEKLMREFSR
ncbi:MAG: YkgJ family cysteine cluster protein [Bacteroidia bacterium]|jgi:hypothetical protein|nr:YkgJ family cysteine cluster protein [Bacteroidia bacterium]